MNETHLSFQICRTPEEFESGKDGHQAVLEGLGRNIIEKSVTWNLGGLCRYSCGTGKTKLLVVQ